VTGCKGLKDRENGFIHRTASYIHVNWQKLQKNSKENTKEPVITVKQGIKNIYRYGNIFN
jgi:hypothetical protein